MSEMDHEFIHIVDVPAQAGAEMSTGGVNTRGVHTIVLLHGTGGDETSLIGLARRVSPDGHLIGVRGRSNEEGINRYFRRFDAITYDQEHIAQESDALAAFIGESIERYQFPRPVIALGYSNGANIALATLIRHPGAFDQMILLRPVMPLENPPESDLTGKEVLILLGQNDPYRPYADAAVTYLKQNGARVEIHDFPGTGHELTRRDVDAMASWIKN